MFVILRYRDVCQKIGPDTTEQSISIESNYVFKKLQMQELDFTPMRQTQRRDRPGISTDTGKPYHCTGLDYVTA
jgi:hypothetical protein